MLDTILSLGQIDSKYWLEDYWNKNGDPRIADYFLMSSFRPIIWIQLIYSIFVLHVGPKMMENRKPFSLKWTMITYNILMSCLNAYFVIFAIVLHNFALDMFDVKFPSFTDRSAHTERIFRLHYLFTISKLFDLLDTIFFILRKKNSQVTVLHFYHHFSVPFQAWSYFRLCGNSAIVIPFGLLNSLVHTIMYAYYGMAAFGPHMRKYLWWKRYLTQLQIVQFVCICIYLIYFIAKQQGYPRYFFYNLLFQSILYIFLFGKYYFTTYRKIKQ
ncbi:hypothetical protein RDWZM_009496 [Blomia tropicalis]|uniref:Elongation of very long chain fatty acids protein n=1 Tax=Blomia tropicalis TaxID=40697 RepID=A0A9Q0M3I8_BLOTA|nr:hypothetical protein BLOT_011829 [Blomia tropicalis]KAJ6218339.1 hypothetical protein RDWZM_009496 [Blomia tropicalis]